MKNLQVGDTGQAVYWLRRNLNLCDKADLSDSDLFDSKMEDAVIDFQTKYGLLADGIVGRTTRKKISELYEGRLRSVYGQEGHLIKRDDAPADKYGDGYLKFNVRADVAEELKSVFSELHSCGAILTSAGGFRDLSVEASNSSMSISSFHYTGRAIDMEVGSGMENPAKDPFVIVAEDDKGRDGCRLHRVYARATSGAQMTLRPVTYQNPLGAGEVTGTFVDLTTIMLRHGFERIRAKPKFYDTSNYPASKRYLSAEWWHFQFQLGLTHYSTTFGSELRFVWPQNQLEVSTPWKECANYVFGEEWN